MNIRNATPADLPLLIEGLEKNRAIEQRDAATSAEDTKAFDAGIASQTIRIAEENGRAVGFAFFRTDFTVLYLREKFLWLDLIYVKEDWRGKGVGTKLMEDVLRIAKERSLPKVVVDIFAVNQDSWEFHNKHGFEPLYTIFEKSV